jgi:hypothetical protein
MEKEKLWVLKMSIIALEVASQVSSLRGIIQNKNLFLVPNTLFNGLTEGNLEFSMYSSFNGLNGY